jgi:hypothetical protein
MCIAEKPFKDCEEVKARIKLCGTWGGICRVLSFLFVIVGIVWEVLKIDFCLESISWFLLAIFFAVISIWPNIHLAVYKHLCGIESEKK